MATQKKNTVYILLSIALIWNYGGMSSNVESDCEFDSPMTYDESSDCPNGAKGLMLCEPGQVKIKPCISADEDTTDICRACTGKFFQANFNRCTVCRSCWDCGTNERVQTHCTTTSDTVCISIFTEPSTTSHESTTELYAGSTTAADKNPEPRTPQASSSGDGRDGDGDAETRRPDPGNAGASSSGGGSDKSRDTTSEVQANEIELTSLPSTSRPTPEEMEHLIAINGEPVADEAVLEPQPDHA
ncbi:uncharacterized protein [Diadema antillarum]|uniref:uncharacterized protein n=1 Tax=Diadema antillarum TaxID=105358 RepID=UPI003A85AA6B